METKGQTIPHLYIALGIVVAIVAIAVVVLIFNKGEKLSRSIAYDDFSVKDFKYEPFSSGSYAVHYDSTKDKIKAEISFIIVSKKDNLYAKIYNKATEEYLLSDERYPQTLRIGDNKVQSYNLFLNTVKEFPQIEICVSTKNEFLKGMEGVLCKTETFPPPKFDITISPETTEFTLTAVNYDREFLEATENKTIIITNSGDVKLSLISAAPNCQEQENYPCYDNPNYRLKCGQYSVIPELKPGESTVCTLRVSFIAFSFEKIPAGSSTATGYLYVPSKYDPKKYGYTLENAIYSKSYNVKTVVVK